MRLGSPTSKSRFRLRPEPFDLLWAVIAPVLALALRDPGLLDPGDLYFSIRPAYEYAFVTSACAIVSFIAFRISDGMSRFFSVRDVLAVGAAVAAAIGSSSVILFVFTRLEGVPRSTPLICGLVMSAGLLFARMAARVLHGQDWGAAMPSSPAKDVRRVVLIGVDRFAATAIKLIDSQRPRTTQIVAALDSRRNFSGRVIGDVKIVGDIEDFGDIIEEYAIHGVAVDEVWICDDARVPAPSVALIEAQCELLGLRLLPISEALNLTPPARIKSAVPAMPPTEPPPYFNLKRFLDVVAASLLLVLLLPVLLIVACLTVFDVGAPILFWQQRVGVRGRKFFLYKFRTFQAPFDANGERVPEAQRLSRVGRMIRASRLDELPQLMNVLVGDMSLIGPRPLLPQDQPADPSTRLLVRPGITGWAQINGGTMVNADEKDALDTWYVRHASLALDIRIVANTIRFLLTGEKLNDDAVREALTFRNVLAKTETASRGSVAFTPLGAPRARSPD